MWTVVKQVHFYWSWGNISWILYNDYDTIIASFLSKLQCFYGYLTSSFIYQHQAFYDISSRVHHTGQFTSQCLSSRVLFFAKKGDHIYHKTLFGLHYWPIEGNKLEIIMIIKAIEIKSRLWWVMIDFFRLRLCCCWSRMWPPPEIVGDCRLVVTALKRT